MRIYSLVLVAFGFLIYKGVAQDEPQGHIVLSDDYLNIFKNMPVLYEYILATLTKNPEVLEYSHQSYSASILDNIQRRNYEEPEEEDDKNYIKKRTVNGRSLIKKRIKRYPNDNVIVYSIADDCSQDEYGNNGRKCGNDKIEYPPNIVGNWNLDTKLQDEIVDNSNVNISNEKKRNTAINDLDEDEINDVGLKNNYKRSTDDVNKADDETNSVDPREVESRAMWAEEMLIKHNNSEE